MTVDIAAVLNLAPVATPASPTPAATSAANNSTNSTNTATTAQDSSTSQNNTHNTSGSDNNTSSHFSQILADKQAQNAPKSVQTSPANTATDSKSKNAKSAASDAASTTSASAQTTTPATKTVKTPALQPDIAAALLVLAQALASATQPAASLTSAASLTNAASGTTLSGNTVQATSSSLSSGSAGDQAVQKALSALASALQATQTSQSVNAMPAASATATSALAGSQNTSATVQGNTTSNSANTTTNTAALTTAVQVAVQQLLAALQANTTSSAPTVPSASASITNTSDNNTIVGVLSSSDVQQLTVLLSQLANTRTGTMPNTVLATSTNSVAHASNITTIAAAPTQTSAQDFANLLNGFLQNTSDANVLGTLSLSDTKDKSSAIDTTSSTASATPSNVAISVPSTQQPAATDAPKFLASLQANAPVVDQVLLQIKSGISEGSSQIKIQLNPQDLGKVTVQMNTASDGKTGITITADNRQTLSMLQSEAKSLQSALRDIGVKTDMGSLSFNLRDQGGNAQHYKQGSFTHVSNTDYDAEETISPAVVASTYTYNLSLNQGLDIRV